MDRSLWTFWKYLFVLEKAYRIRLPRLSLMQHLEEHFGQEALVAEGELTELGLEILRRMRPEIDPSHFRPGVRVEEINRLLTAQTFVRLVLRLLEAKSEALQKMQEDGCGSCSSSHIRDSDVAPEFTCDDCGAVFPVPSGDDTLMQDVLSLGLDDGR